VRCQVLTNSLDIFSNATDQNNPIRCKGKSRKPHLFDETWNEIQKNRKAKQVLNKDRPIKENDMICHLKRKQKESSNWAEKIEFLWALFDRCRSRA
jgi:hypothetical protein